MELDESRGAFLADRYQRANAQSAAELLGCSGLQWIVLLSHQCYPTGLYRLDDGQCDSVPFRGTKFEGKFMLVSAFTPQSLDVITAGRSHGDLRYFWSVHNPIHSSEQWSWIFPGERLL